MHHWNIEMFIERGSSASPRFACTLERSHDIPNLEAWRAYW